MMKPALSPAAAGLLRALVERGATDRHRILLSDAQSREWHSLTFSGERHRVDLHVTGSDGLAVATVIADGIEEAEFAIAGQVVADIHVLEGPTRLADGSATLSLEALTVSE